MNWVSTKTPDWSEVQGVVRGWMGSGVKRYGRVGGKKKRKWKHLKGKIIFICYRVITNKEKLLANIKTKLVQELILEEL